MTIQTKTFAQIVSDAVTAVQGSASQLVDMTIGSVLRAFVESVSGLGLWLQGVALQIAALTRFATSNGADADSWAADFNFLRLPAIAATGPVTFARFTATSQATVPVGTTVQTADGSQKFTVVADTAQTAYNAGLNAYVLAPTVSSITATVVSQSAASAGNVAAGILNTIGSSLPGVDTVTNVAGFTNGADAEADTTFRARFVTYIASLSKATSAAVKSAVTSLKQNVNCTVTENLTYAGAASLGYFYVVVDDGTGAPSGIFLSTVANAVDAVRPIGSTFNVYAPTIVTANVNMTITTAAGYLHSAVVASVVAALQAYINTLLIGVPLPYTYLAAIAYGVPGVTNVSAVTLNTTTADLASTNQQVIKAGAIAVG